MKSPGAFLGILLKKMASRDGCILLTNHLPVHSLMEGAWTRFAGFHALFLQIIENSRMQHVQKLCCKIQPSANHCYNKALLACEHFVPFEYCLCSDRSSAWVLHVFKVGRPMSLMLRMPHII